MAAKSDFAQKLLHDLRLRKERMGVSQGSTYNHATARDAYRDPGTMQRGTRQSKSLKSIGGSKSMNQQLMTSRRSDKSLNMKQTSQQIVTYTGRQHQRSESFGDLSMAFTYAVKNGANLLNMDFSSSSNTNTMIDFLSQIGRRSLDSGNARNGAMTSLVKHRPENGGVAPALTTIQIKEISKGVHNLYEIIRSSSNGTNVNRYSMEVGKELLKGAKGLEESLKMLVSLQEASELMVSQQRKSRVTLLEVDDNDDHHDENDDRLKVVDRNQVALPRFSFDKPSKKSNLPLADGCSKFPTHQRSGSGGAESVGSVSSAKPASNHSEKGRISNVIAKLMGLEEVPLKLEREEIKKVDDHSTTYKAKDTIIPGKLKSYSKRDEIKKADDLTKNTVKKTSTPVKDVVVTLNDQEPQQIRDSNMNVKSRINQSSKNNALDRVSEKKERQSNGESKEKMHTKRRSPESAANLQVEKKKIVRTEKSNAIKLVPRNNQVHEQKSRIQKIKQYSQNIKPVKNTNLVSKELKPQPVEEGNQNVKDATPKSQKQETTQDKMVSVTRKKLDSIVVVRTESPRAKDEVLRRRNLMMNNLSTPSKHKLSVLKETKAKEVHTRSEPEETNTKKSISTSVSNENKTEPPARLNESVPICVYETKSAPQTTSDIVVKNAEISYKDNIPEIKPKKAFNSSMQVVLTEHEKQLKEILIKDQLFLSTAEALYKLNIPVGFFQADDQNYHNNETKLKLDCGYEILKRKARSQELSVHPYAKASVGDTSIRFLDELVKQLYKDFEGLRLYGGDTSYQYDEADYLHHMLEKDMNNKYPDINSFWDFGWHVTTFTFVEKDEFVNDVEQDIVHRLVDEIIEDLLRM